MASPEGWAAHYDQMQAQFRRARPASQTDVAAITAWLRMGELQAARLQTANYSATALEAALPAMRALTLAPVANICPGLVRLCSQAGLALVFVPALPGAHVSGMARCVAGKPLIQLSLLGKWNDGFWFSFFHEVAHVLKHPTRAIFLDDASAGDTVETAEEQEANRFATDQLIPRAQQAPRNSRRRSWAGSGPGLGRAQRGQGTVGDALQAGARHESDAADRRGSFLTWPGPGPVT